jgi:hypothetical protein
LPGFNTHYDQIDRANFCNRIRSFRRLNHKIAVRAVDPEAFTLDCAQMFATSNESYVFAVLSKTPSKVPTDATGAKDCDSHNRSIQI